MRLNPDWVIKIRYVLMRLLGILDRNLRFFGVSCSGRPLTGGRRLLALCVFQLFLFASLLGIDGAAAENQTHPRTAAGWSVMERDGIQWLVAPDGKPFYSKGVNRVAPGNRSTKSRKKQAYFAGNFHPSLDDWRRSVTAQLSGWGFNTRGGWSDPSRKIDLPLTVDLELGRNSSFHWFDPFDPGMEQKVMQWARRLTAPHRNDPRLMGYFSDNEVGWWNSALFEFFVGKGWDNHTKRVLWRLLHESYGGQWERLLQDWVPKKGIGSFEDLRRRDVQLKLRPGGEGIRLVDRFMVLYTRHYYDLMFRAIRKAHPGALVLGDRLPLYYHQDAILAMGDNIDVISTNYNVDVPDGWVAPYYFDGLRRLTGKPVLVSEYFFAAEENRSGNRNETARSQYPQPGHLMTVQTQEERALGAANATKNFARFPNVVGAHWFQYCDEPLGGREDGEDYNMGLIDTAGRPYEEVSEVFRSLNSVIEKVHEEGPSTPATRVAVGAAESHHVASGIDQNGGIVARASGSIDVSDQSLMDWSKERTLLKDFQTPQPYVPFGDVHVAWAPEGLYLATIANTFVDPKFLAYQGEFPASEAFQIHLFVEAGGGRNHFAVFLIPREEPLSYDGFEVEPRLFRYRDGNPSEPLPAKGHVQRFNKSLPHMVLEAFIPVEWLGLNRLEPGMELKMNIALMSYYRELTMTWSGTPTLRDAENPGSLRTIMLRDLDGEQQRPERIGLR